MANRLEEAIGRHTDEAQHDRVLTQLNQLDKAGRRAVVRALEASEDMGNKVPARAADALRKRSITQRETDVVHEHCSRTRGYQGVLVQLLNQDVTPDKVNGIREFSDQLRRNCEYFLKEKNPARLATESTLYRLEAAHAKLTNSFEKARPTLTDERKAYLESEIDQLIEQLTPITNRMTALKKSDSNEDWRKSDKISREEALPIHNQIRPLTFELEQGDNLAARMGDQLADFTSVREHTLQVGATRAGVDLKGGQKIIGPYPKPQPPQVKEPAAPNEVADGGRHAPVEMEMFLDQNPQGVAQQHQSHESPATSLREQVKNKFEPVPEERVDDVGQSKFRDNVLQKAAGYKPSRKPVSGALDRTAALFWATTEASGGAAGASVRKVTKRWRGHHDTNGPKADGHGGHS